MPEICRCQNTGSVTEKTVRGAEVPTGGAPERVVREPVHGSKARESVRGQEGSVVKEAGVKNRQGSVKGKAIIRNRGQKQ